MLFFSAEVINCCCFHFFGYICSSCDVCKLRTSCCYSIDRVLYLCYVEFVNVSLFLFNSSFCSECASLVEKCAEWDIDITFNREKVYENDRRIADFRALIAARQVSCDQASIVLEELKERVRDSRGLVESLWDRCEVLSVRCVKLVDLERDLDQIREEIESARLIVEAGTERLDERTDSLDATRERIVHLETNAGIRDAEIFDLEQRIDTARNRMNALREKLEEKTRIADVLGRELN